ncbi:MAG TPA: ATP-binding cassette domain-containing protein [Gammaproteobacteria bacterium]|nr:ATP-binding cassette domain-containing protein [Gammaproteobacteria bacterium]
MLKFENLSIRRGVRELFRDVTFTIHERNKVGITGANGVGKSSLFALIRGKMSADLGNFSLPARTVIAHVAQETPAVDKSALDYVIDGDEELRGIEQKISVAEQDNDGEKLGHLYHDLEVINGYTAASRAGQLLHGLGFSSAQEQLPVATFSGGWRMRLNLAQALMCRSDLLLLDEPTNHLDLEAVIWLEDWLKAYPGTLLLISHDRDFLDRVTTHIAHMEQEGIVLYTGNYTAFEKMRAERLANQQAAYEKQQREVKHMQSFVDRFRAKATKARQAQSRIKALERMTMISQAHVDSPFDFHFSETGNMPNPLLSIDEVTAGYDDTIILNKVRMTIAAGDRIGLLGHNGAGKSTLIKLLAGEINPMSGGRVEAKALNIGYFAQHQLEQLDLEASALLHLQRIDKRASEAQLRKYLGGFAFSGDMATSPVAPFSGGEKARLVLAMIVYQKPNLLLLDEPTNHLDIEMRLALSIALQEFEGAMIIVSHDRHMLRTVTDTLLLVHDGQVDDFTGDLDDYQAWVKESNKDKATPKKSDKGNTKKVQRQQSAEQRKQKKTVTAQIRNLEKSIEKHNKKLATLLENLADSSIYNDENKLKLQQLQLQQTEIKVKLEADEELWMEANSELETLTEPD